MRITIISINLSYPSPIPLLSLSLSIYLSLSPIYPIYRGDVIISVDNKPIRRSRDIHEAIGFGSERALKFRVVKGKSGVEMEALMVPAPERPRRRTLF